MATSSTYDFNPSLGALTLQAFQLCGLRPTSLVQEHYESARMATNMLLGRWSSDGVDLWQVDLQTVPLIEGVATYSVPASTITILDMYVTVTSGGVSNNRLILPVSRSEYASYPNPDQEGFPTVAWFNRQLSPEITLWPVPDGSQTSFSYYRLRQSQDANLTGGQTVEIPYYFMEALTYGLAQRLALIWAPDKVPMLKAFADESYEIAAKQNVETAQVYISPMISSYFNP